MDFQLCACMCAHVYMYPQQEVKDNLHVYLIHGSSVVLGFFFTASYFASYFPLSLQRLKHLNACIYSKNELFLQYATELHRNTFLNP